MLHLWSRVLRQLKVCGIKRRGSRPLLASLIWTRQGLGALRSEVQHLANRQGVRATAKHRQLQAEDRVTPVDPCLDTDARLGSLLVRRMPVQLGSLQQLAQTPTGQGVR